MCDLQGEQWYVENCCFSVKFTDFLASNRIISEVLKKFNGGSAYVRQQENAWMTEAIFVDYLNWLFPERLSSAHLLTLDTASAHGYKKTLGTLSPTIENFLQEQYVWCSWINLTVN